MSETEKITCVATVNCRLQMNFARTRAKKLIVHFCVNVNPVHVIQKAMLRLSRILSKITVISRCPISWMLVICACIIEVQCFPTTEKPLFDNASLWQNPCNVRSYHESNTNKTKAISPKEREVFLNRVSVTTNVALIITCHP